MKKIIDGKLYNTATAETIGEWDNGYSGGDFRRASVALCRTKKGQYFLWGEGGPMSTWGTEYGAERTSSEDIVLLSESEAKEWAEEYLPAKICEEHWEYEEG